MKRKLTSWQYYIDKIGLYLSVFFILLSILFIYLKKINSDINDYDMYRQNIEQIKILNYKMDSYFLHPYKYIDYDKSNKIEQDLENSIHTLTNKSFIYLIGLDNKQVLDRLVALFKDKKEYFESFKSVNARVTNSLHYLFDMRKTLEKQLINSPELKTKIDSVFFMVSQILMDMPYDSNSLENELKYLEAHYQNQKVIHYFVKQSKQFIVDVELINKIINKSLSIPIVEFLDGLDFNIGISYKISRKRQSTIAFIFFVFAFLILILLIFSFRKLHQNALELKAFRFAIENSDNAILITNTNREITYVNETFEQRTGYTKEEVFGKNPSILKSGLVSRDLYDELNQTLQEQKNWHGEFINRKKDGSIFYEKASIVPMVVKDKVVQYIGIKLDITEYKEQEKRLQQASIVYENIGDGIIITDANQTIIDVNPAFVEMFGYSKNELLGQDPMLFQTDEDNKLLYEQMWSKLRYTNRYANKVYAKTKDGKRLYVWLTIALIRDKDSKIQNYIGIYTDLSEIIASQEKAEYLAYHDSLTDLPNRAYLDMQLKDMIELVKKIDRQIAVLFIDLDRFKIINDTLGHSVGDLMLIEIGRRIRSIISKDTLFARIGGDEFVIVIMGEDIKQKAEDLAKKVLSIVRKPINAYNYHLNTTASIGISIYPDHAKNKQELLQYADAAMYAAKDNGKDTFKLYNTKLSLYVKDRLNIEQELSKALEKDEFYLCYQPQYDIQNSKITGVEALLRWENETLGFVSPNEFIEIAEETGIIISIGYYVLEEACKAYVRWQKLGYSFDRISINVTTIQFREEDFVDKVKDIFQKTGIDPKNVEIEITERFIMEFSLQKISILEKLRDLGCYISIDDFGTGYSSMNYLKKLPLDTIKIDKSFIDEIPINIHDVVVTKAIIALSKNLGYKVIAEGIETKEQEEFLKENGCDIGQGYYFSKPMMEADLIEFLKEKL